MFKAICETKFDHMRINSVIVLLCGNVFDIINIRLIRGYREAIL